MGTNYYFVPKNFDADKVKELHKDYTNKLDSLLKDYIEKYNKMCKEMSDENDDIFQTIKLQDYNDWCNCMYLQEIEYPKLHICKISFGWNPLFQSTGFYSNVNELKEFYNKNKDKIYIKDEYGETQNIDELLEYIDKIYENKKNQTHIDSYFDQDGYEWVNHEFL